MMPPKDYYRVLGVREDAGTDVLKRAYRERVRLLHPDYNDSPAAAEHFRMVQEAYEVLSHPRSRADYDRLYRLGPLALDDRPLDDFAGRMPLDGVDADRHVRVQLSFEEALAGGHRDVQAPDGEVVRVTIPRGACDRLMMRIRGRGGPRGNGHAGARGDLYVMFQVQPHPRFRREGLHLHVVETISAVEAMLGTTRSIQNAYGRSIRVPIRPGTQPGDRLRLRGQGVATPVEKGDLFVEVDVQVPKELSDVQRAQLLQTARDLGLL